MRLRFALFGVFPLLGLGCGDGGGGTSSGTPTGPVSDVTGKLVDVHVTETGDVLNAKDPSLYEVAASLAGADGARTEILGIASVDGTFRIPNVPEGPYDLRFTEAFGTGTLAPRYIMNAPRDIDLGRVYVGRPDTSVLAETPTELSISAKNLAAWSDDDALEIFSLGSATAGLLAPTNGVFPTADVTELVNYKVDVSAVVVPNLIDSSLGDTATITQLKNAPGGALFAAYRSVAKILAPAPFSLVDGGTAVATGAFTDVEQKDIAISIDSSSFKALAAAVNPSSQDAGPDINLIAEPGGERATTSLTPTLLRLASGSALGVPSKMSYGNPFPSEWSEVLSVGWAFGMTHTMPTGVPKSTVVTVGRSGPPSSFTGKIKPTLGPPLDIKVNDQPAIDTVLGVGKTPTLRWSPPALGTPSAYVIALRKLDLGGATTRTVASFSTTETSLRLPDGLLDVGFYYYVRIGVRSTFDPKTPLRGGNTNEYASALTGIISP